MLSTFWGSSGYPKTPLCVPLTACKSNQLELRALYTYSGLLQNGSKINAAIKLKTVEKTVKKYFLKTFVRAQNVRTFFSLGKLFLASLRHRGRFRAV